MLEDPLVRELLEARLVCVLATFDVTGPIHAVPMWCAPGDGCVLLATASRSRKVRNLEHDPRATLVVHDSRPGFDVCGVAAEGVVELVRGAPATALVGRVHRRYVEASAEQIPDVRHFLGSDDLALRFRPHTALTWDERGSVADVVLRAYGGALPLVPTDPRP